MDFISTPVEEKAYSDDQFLMDDAEETEEGSLDEIDDNQEEDDDGPDNY